jgi:hypothetical protein
MKKHLPKREVALVALFASLGQRAFAVFEQGLARGQSQLRGAAGAAKHLVADRGGRAFGVTVCFAEVLGAEVAVRVQFRIKAASNKSKND